MRSLWNILLLSSLQFSLSFQIPASRPNRVLKMSSDSEQITEVRTSNSPAPLGPYSQAVLAGRTLYCSGQIALDPSTGEFVGGGDVQKETSQALKNMDAVLKEAGASAANVVRCTVFLFDLNDFAKVNEIYADYFKDSTVAPSRSCVQVAALPKGALVEIDCIAVL
jgi:2-iminobutanoate/2-iminopropanoate deaminase